MSDLEKRISTALSSDGLGSAELAALYSETEAAIREADAAAEREREAAFDPALRPDPHAARQAMEDRVFMANRLRTMLPRLAQRHSDVQLAEARERFNADFAAVEEKRDALAKELLQQYPKITKYLLGLFNAIGECDKQCAQINSAASALPGERRRLAGAELAARNLEKFTADQPSLLASLDNAYGVRLPDFTDSKRMAWPPPQPSFAATAAAAVALVGVRDPDDCTDDWWRAAERRQQAQREADDRRIREEEQRSADAMQAYYASLQR